MADQRTMAELLQAPTEGYGDGITSAVTTAMTAMLKQLQANPPLASVKAAEETCVACGGAHPYYQCLATCGNTFPEFRDNIQSYVSAAAVNYNQGNLVGETSTNPKRHNRKRSKQRIEPFSIEETPVVTMADQRTMAELLQAPTEGYGDQCFDESFCEAWDRFKDLLRVYPHHGFTELHQLDTFYNALTPADQDSLIAATGGNLLTKTPRDVLTIIENKSKVRNSQNKPVVTKVSTNAPSSTPHFLRLLLLPTPLRLCFFRNLLLQLS
nr:reverse transcriptase domain-containing protein [Tanacetum cinerariifolium]